jgi:hypothetical protein
MLREIATKYRLKMRGARRLSPPVGPRACRHLRDSQISWRVIHG